MKVLCCVLLALFLLALLPLGVRVRYGQDGVSVDIKVWFLRFRVYPARAGKAKREKKPKPEKKAPPAQAEEHKKGGALDAVRAALPLVKPALAGVKKRLTIRELTLHVTWAAADPADAAVGYGCAQAALGTLWAVVEQNFKVKQSRLGCSVDFDQTAPTLYADAVLTIRLGQMVTLVLPLLCRFLSNSSRLRREKAEKTKKEV